MSDSFFKDLETLKVAPEGLTGGGAREVLTQVPVRKPDRREFIRAHPNPEMSLVTTVYTDKETRETFFVPPNMRNALLGEAKVVLIAVAITLQHVAFLWPVPLPDETGRDYPWWETAREAYELAKTSWVRVVPDMQLGAYRIYKAEGELSEPKWPTRHSRICLRSVFVGGSSPARTIQSSSGSAGYRDSWRRQTAGRCRAPLPGNLVLRFRVPRQPGRSA